MKRSSVTKRVRQGMRRGFLLVEALVSLVIVSSTLGLLVLILNRAETLHSWLKSGKELSGLAINKYKLAEAHVTRAKNVYTIKQLGTSEAVGKKLCGFSMKELDNANFAASHVSRFRIIDVASSTEITFVKVIKDQIYIGLDSSSTTDPDILVYPKREIMSRLNSGYDTDVSKDTAVYSLDSGPGVRSAIVAGNMLFVLGSGTAEHVRGFHILNNGLPQLAWTHKLPISGAAARAFAFDAESNSLFIGLEKNDGHEFFSIKIDANRTVGYAKSKEIGGTVNYIYTFDGKVYVMNTLDPEIQIFDTHSLEKVGEYDAVGVVGNGKRLDHLSGGFIFGRTIYGNEVSYISQISTSSAPLSTISLGEEWGQKIRASVDDIITVDGGFILLSTQSGGQIDLYRLDVPDSELLAPEFRLVRTFNLPYGRGTDLFCDQYNLYITARYEPVFYILPIK